MTQRNTQAVCGPFRARKAHAKRSPSRPVYQRRKRTRPMTSRNTVHRSLAQHLRTTRQHIAQAIEAMRQVITLSENDTVEPRSLNSLGEFRALSKTAVRCLTWDSDPSFARSVSAFLNAAAPTKGVRAPVSQ